MGYLCANFSLSRPLRSRLRAKLRDRQTSDVKRVSSLNALYHKGGELTGYTFASGPHFGTAARGPALTLLLNAALTDVKGMVYANT